MNANIAALIEKHLNATLTASEAAALAQAIADSPALADEFAAATRMEADLSAAMKEKERTALYTRRMERAAAETAPARTRRSWPVKTMTAAAGLAALIGVGWRLMEVDPGNRTTAKKGSTASPRSAAGANSASHSSDNRLADASSMKRKLRRFASSTSRLRSFPVSQALAALQSEWKNYAHSNAKDKDAVFVVAEAVRQQWQKPEDEPAVSLEIPGISLLTGIELIAAQAGLKATVTAAGVSLEPFPRKDDGKQRTWSIPLSLSSVATFMSRASKQPNVVIGDYKPDIILVAGDEVGIAHQPAFTFKPVTELAASQSSYEYTVDLDLTPEEVAEFEGFINYDEPIAQGEPVILTDSGITLPTFADLALIPGNLTRLLAAHGMPAEGATWDQEHGVVVARGPLCRLRAAQAAAAAVEEAATAGVMVEMKVIEWKKGVPAPVADRSGLLPPPVTGQSVTISAEAASELFGDPDLERVAITKATQRSGMAFTLTDTRGHGDNIAAAVITDVSGITGSGFSWHLPVKIRREDTNAPISGIARSREEMELSGQRFDLRLEDGEWLRVDFPAKGDANAMTVFLSVQPATVQP